MQETTVLGDTGSKFEVPNAALQPERSLALELGGRAHLGRLSLHVAGFVNRLSNVIDERQISDAERDALGISASDTGGKPVVQRVNRASGQFIGGQASLRLRVLARLSAFAQLGWTQGDVTRADGTTTPARRVAPALGTVGLRWQRRSRGVWLEVYSRFMARQDRLHPSDEKDLRICADSADPAKIYAKGTCRGTAGWATLNVRGGYRVRPGLRVDVALTNLLDKRYRVHGSGLDASGVGGTVSLAGRY